MEKVVKFIKKLDRKRREQIYPILFDIYDLNLDHLDIKKLQGYENRFRVRVGKIRIIFEKRGKQGIVLEINTRGDIY